MGTLKLQSNGPLTSNTVIGTLAVDGGCYIWYNTTAIDGLSGLRLRPVPSSLYQMEQTHPSMVSVQTSSYSVWHYNCVCTIKGSKSFELLTPFEWRNRMEAIDNRVPRSPDSISMCYVTLAKKATPCCCVGKQAENVIGALQLVILSAAWRCYYQNHLGSSLKRRRRGNH